MLPLTGVKVVEIANNVAGPYAGFILAALGADVLKVERPDGGDDARGWGPPFWRGTSATFQALNVNKRGVTLDLKEAAEIAQLKVLVSEADVLVHNLRPGVLEGLGLGSAALTALNPRLVYCAISAFGAKRADAGQHGLRAHRAGVRGPVLHQRLSRPAGSAHGHLGARPRARRRGRRSAASRAPAAARRPARAAWWMPRSTRRRWGCSRCTSPATRPAASCRSGIRAAAWRW